MSDAASSCVDVFLACRQAIANGQLVVRTNRGDKEFHFQNWFRQRLEDAGLLYEQAGRNSYPDFRLVQRAEGYEVKGLAYPGREASYDANSQVPTGFSNGRTIFSIFGRYPAEVIENEYPGIDLVVCHGDFLNAHHEYVHQNKSVRGFGSYGDILIRDRKMYVVPTPYALTRGTAGRCTLILPRNMPGDDRLDAVGDLTRIETDHLVVGYAFDLTTNELTPRFTPNPDSGLAHHFVAYRTHGEGGSQVSLTTTALSINDEFPDE